MTHGKANKGEKNAIFQKSPNPCLLQLTAYRKKKEKKHQNTTAKQQPDMGIEKQPALRQYQ